ncbi:MAG: ISAs1 family transposase, partial [Verrucomicrobiota bacterium]|nr:ISAs1 family transposase [Verrucomicrobiota bacterium]
MHGITHMVTRTMTRKIALVPATTRSFGCGVVRATQDSGGSNTRTMRYEPPRETTIRRILKQVRAEEFDEAVTAWMAEHDSLPLKQLAVDGKTIKGSRQKDGRPAHLVGGVSVGSGRLVAQRAVDEKSNEITALKPVLKDVALDGVVASADAMHAQQETARFLMEEKGAHCFFTLKGNQPAYSGQSGHRFRDQTGQL